MVTARSKPPDSSKSATYSGLILAFEPKRTTAIAEYVEAGFEIRESFSAVDWQLKTREVALLVLDQGSKSIGGALLLERMHRSGGTKKLMMKSIGSALWQPIGAEAFGLWLTDLISTAERVRRVPTAEWSKTLQAIRKARPEGFAQLQQLLVERARVRRFEGEGEKVRRLEEQRDALGVCLDVAGLDRQEILSSVRLEKANRAKSVLDLIDTLPIQERSLVEHDAARFPALLRSRFRGARFTTPSSELRVYVADKAKLETILGIDLLIYQAQFDSFLLLQYKGMTRPDKSAGWTYTVDQNLEEQLRKMLKWRAKLLKNSKAQTGLWGQRLSAEAFFVKFCERTKTEARGDELIGGITMPVNHLAEFLQLPDSKTEHGSRQVSYSNCPRYLTNTDFVGLARAGWIGSSPPATGVLSEIIASSRRSKRSSMFAVIEKRVRDTSAFRRSLQGGRRFG